MRKVLVVHSLHLRHFMSCSSTLKSNLATPYRKDQIDFDLKSDYIVHVSTKPCPYFNIWYNIIPKRVWVATSDNYWGWISDVPAATPTFSEPLRLGDCSILTTSVHNSSMDGRIPDPSLPNTTTAGYCLRCDCRAVLLDPNDVPTTLQWFEDELYLASAVWT